MSTIYLSIDLSSISLSICQSICNRIKDSRAGGNSYGVSGFIVLESKIECSEDEPGSAAYNVKIASRF